MADLVLDTIVVTDTPWQDDGDTYPSSYYSYGTPAVAHSFITSLTSRKANYENRGADGVANLVKDAVKAGIDTIFLGETHIEFSAFLSTYLKAIQAAGQNKISFATLELPYMLNDAFQAVQAGGMNFTEFKAATGLKAAYAAPVYNFISGAAAMGTTVVAADFGSLRLLTEKTQDAWNERLVTDNSTYASLKAMGVFDPNKTSIVHQGINHIINGIGTSVKGVDDYAAAAGNSTLSVGYYPSVNAVKNGVNAFNTTFTADPADISFVNSKVSIKATAASLITSNGGTIPGGLLNALDNFNYIEAKQGVVNGTSANDLIVDKGATFTANGGAGIDTVSYALSGTGVRVDMENPSNNTGLASGDKYSSIEKIYGSRYADDLRGTKGDDILIGDVGNDTLTGRNGNDTLYGGLGEDILYGGGLNDRLYGGEGRDMLHGESGNDTLYGEQGNDVLWGQEGNDTLYGNAHADALLGGAGNDKLYGNSGDDSLNGGAGNDSLDGGTGKDRFIFGSNDGTDHIVDFSNGEDRLCLYDTNGGGLSGFKTQQSGNDVRITFDNTTIILDNTSLSEINVTRNGSTMFEIY